MNEVPIDLSTVELEVENYMGEDTTDEFKTIEQEDGSLLIVFNSELATLLDLRPGDKMGFEPSADSKVGWALVNRSAKARSDEVNKLFMDL